MLKYVAVVRDSFREALASRVLWLVLLLITLLLVSLAPLGFDEELTWRLGEADGRNWPELLERVRDAAGSDRPSPDRRIWELLDPSQQRQLASVQLPGEGEDPPNPFAFISALREFRRELNNLLTTRTFYDETAFAEVPLVSAELRQLQDEGLDQLSDAELARHNRLVLEAAYRQLIRASSPTSIQLRYGWFEVGGPIPLRGESLRESLQSVVTSGLDWFIGAIGILIAILVTAPIIPQMFDPGSLHLLLSKPVSRSLLFLAKFAGGCAFILIAATYLISGLWLILGLRFGIWDTKLLWSIPVYLFVFAIYYSVAAFVGAVWRSPIVVVALTIIFWGACTLIGWSKGLFERAIWSKERIVRVFEAEGDLFVASEAGILKRWDARDSEWEETMVSTHQRQAAGFRLLMPTVPREMRPVGPIYDPQTDRLFAAHPAFPPSPPIKQHFYVAEREAGFEPESTMLAPTGTSEMFLEPDGKVLAISSLGIYRLTGDPLAVQEPAKIFGFTLPVSLGGAFQNVSPDPPVLLTQPSSAAYDAETESLLLYTRGQLTLLEGDSEGRFSRTLELSLDGDEREPVVVALAGSTLGVGREDGRIQFFERENGELIFESQPGQDPRFLYAGARGERFAVVFHNGELWLSEPRKELFWQPRITGQGDISAAQFAPGNRLYVAHGTIRVSEYQLPDLELETRYLPELGLMETGYLFGLVPLYTIFPKPGELNTTIEYLLSGAETERLDDDDLASAQREIDPWTPVWSSALFVVVMLLAGCIYMERQDF